MLGIPINPTTLFLLSLSLSFRRVSLARVFLPNVYPTSSPTSSSKSSTTIFHSGRGGARGGGPPFSRLSCASHAVSTRVNFNSLSNDPRGSDLTDTRRPPLVRYKTAIRVSSIIRVHCAIRITDKLHEECLMYLMTLLHKCTLDIRILEVKKKKDNETYKGKR